MLVVTCTQLPSAQAVTLKDGEHEANGTPLQEIHGISLLSGERLVACIQLPSAGTPSQKGLRVAKSAVVVKIQATQLQSGPSPLQRQSQQPPTAVALGALERKLAPTQMPPSQWMLTPSCRQHQMDATAHAGRTRYFDPSPIASGVELNPLVGHLGHRQSAIIFFSAAPRVLE